MREKLGTMRPRACIIKLFTTVINSVTQKARVFVKERKKLPAIEKALAYCTTKIITTIKVL
jgi:hypothetical protein